MNNGDAYLAEVVINNHKSIRPIVFVDKDHFNIITTTNKNNFTPCSLNGKDFYIVPENISIKNGVTLNEYLGTIDIN